MIDVPISVPKPAQLPRSPIKAPSPPDEPPELRLRFLGFQVYPITLLTVSPHINV